MNCTRFSGAWVLILASDKPCAEEGLVTQDYIAIVIRHCNEELSHENQRAHINNKIHTLACNHSAKCCNFFVRVFSPTDQVCKAFNSFSHDFSVLALSSHSVNISIQAALLFLASCWMVFRSFGLMPITVSPSQTTWWPCWKQPAL